MLVDPPIATSSAIAFSNASRQAMARGSTDSSSVGVVAAGQLAIAVPARSNRPCRAVCVASVVPLPGSARPIASVRQFIELAVNMPEQEPHVGQADSSMSSSSSSDTDGSADGDHRVDQVELPPARGEGGRAGRRPASIGPPETKTVGMFSRIVAISMPGVILSQLEMQISASAQCAFDHVLDGVGDQLAARQRIQHAAVAHGDAVVHGDGVELARDRAGRADRVRDDLADFAQVDVPGNELGEAVGDRDDRPADVLAGDARGAQQGTGARHVSAVRDSAGPKRWHDRSSPK